MWSVTRRLRLPLSHTTARSFATMRQFNNVESYQKYRHNLYKTGDVVGLVPTMGALHEGHLSLVRQARKECDKVVVSIFVNPKQFAPGEDFEAYPRTMDADLKLLENENVDAVFSPDVSSMYAKNHATWVDFEGIDSISEGKSRPGFFRGVATVVSKLFHITQPHRAYFGQKDGLQCLVIKRMTRELSFPIDIVVGETRREEDGLAMSSRNAYLSDEDRKVAPVLYRSLNAVRESYEEAGQRSYEALQAKVNAVLAEEGKAEVLYVSIADARTGEECSGMIDNSVPLMISLAVRVGKTRLIDNILLNEQKHSD